jgi:Uncharacterised nucleotidyltransferase
MIISPEARFVTLCAREPDAASVEAIASAARLVTRWDDVVATAIRHRMTAYVAEAALRCQLRLPEGVSRRLDREALSLLARVMLLSATLDRVIEALGAAGVPFIILKGAALARTLYPSALLRPYDDIDLSVSPRHEEEAAAVLRGLGFDEVPPEEAGAGDGDEAWPGVGLHRMFLAPETRAVVELHAEALQLGIAPACEDGRWLRARPIPSLAGARMLSPEDQVVHLAAHVHKHGFERLIWLKDLDLLVRAHRDRLDWELARDVAVREGVGASVWMALTLAAELLGTPLTGAPLARLRPRGLTRALYRLVWPTTRIVGLRGFTRIRAVQFRPSDSWRGMLPGLVLMGRRLTRARALAATVLRRAREIGGTRRSRGRRPRPGSGSG